MFISDFQDSIKFVVFINQVSFTTTILALLTTGYYHKYIMLLITWVGKFFFFIWLSYQNVAHHSFTEKVKVFCFI